MDMNWIIEDNSLVTNDLLKNESVFNISNGYIGVRGNFEEGYKVGMPTIRGSYINAFFEEVPITYGENAYGFPDKMQKIVNVIDAQTIKVKLGDESFNVFEGEVKEFKRWIDMKKGYTVRQIHWISPQGKEIRLTITRMASFTTLELFTIQYEIEKLNFEEEVTIISELNGEVENYTNPNDPRVGAGNAKILEVIGVNGRDERFQVACKTKASQLSVVATVAHEMNREAVSKVHEKEKKIIGYYTFPKEKGNIIFSKYSVFTDSRRHEKPEEQGIEILKQAINKGIKKVFEEQETYLETFWEVANIEIGGDTPLQQGLRYNVYQLLQGVGKDKFSNITAKGLSGEGYEGHYFWDTEIYILPFFILCNPKLAKQLLRYRYTILDEAKIRAKELGHKKGAAYAWRTITGKECSPYFPAGTAQYHLNGDIAYTYIQYYLATGDRAFIKEFGAEVIFETARIWLEIGHFHEGRFKIDDVTGPDEYTAIVNNNYYTNVLAKYNLKWATKWYKELKENESVFLSELCKKIDLKEDEISLFEKASKAMYLPYNKELDINEQDDTFLAKKVWDFENTPKENYPLLLHYHPLTIYRHQVLKQADTVLSHFLLEDETTLSTVKNSYDYYERLTTHDSSLSCAVYSIMASKVGYQDKAYNYFIETARLDLDNTHNNTKDGLHMANMGGTWMSIIYGFAGVRIKEDRLLLNPTLPKQWEKLKFKILYNEAVIKVEMAKKATTVRVKTKQAICLQIREKIYNITEGITTLTV